MSYLGTNSIGKVFLGSTQIGKAYLGTQLVYQYGSGPGPTTIPYIRGGADGSYIDTGITPDNTTKVIVWARNFNPVCSFLFGSRDAITTNTFCIGSHGNLATGDIRLDYAQSNATYARDQFANLSHYHKYEFYQGALKVDDVTVATATGSAFSNNHSIHLFGCNNNETHANTTLPIDICACKIYKNDTLVRDFTPVQSPSVGFYDSVSQTVLTNAGGGSFEYRTFVPDSYTPLQYVSCADAASYIDTGVYGTKSLPVVVKFRIIGTALGWPDLFGTFRSGVSGTYFLLEFSNSSYPNRYAKFYIDSGTANEIYNNNSTKLTGLDVIFAKDSTSAQLIRNHATFGTKKTFTAGTSFSTSPDTLMLGAAFNNGALQNRFNGYIYYAGFGEQKNFVPAKVNNVAGLYETYSDVFYPSVSGVDFVAGPELL